MEKQRCVKMDEIMKNMLIHALRDLFRKEMENGHPIEDTKNLVLKLADYKDTKLFLTDVEYKKTVQALNMLRDTFINAGRYTDGIDIVLMKILRAKYKRCATR